MVDGRPTIMCPTCDPPESGTAEVEQLCVCISCGALWDWQPNGRWMVHAWDLTAITSDPW